MSAARALQEDINRKTIERPPAASSAAQEQNSSAKILIAAFAVMASSKIKTTKTPSSVTFVRQDSRSRA
jgi:hypothetical protein